MPIVKCLKCEIATQRQKPVVGEKCQLPDEDAWPVITACGGALTVTRLDEPRETAAEMNWGKLMKFKCNRCGNRVLQKATADRVCPAVHPLTEDPDNPVMCGGVLIPDPEAGKVPDKIHQYKCDKCGHECGRENHDNGMVCMVPAQPFGHFICGGVMRRIDRAPTMAEKYPAYYKDVRHLEYIDVYETHHLFQVDDPSGCLPHASKKILLSGVRTGGKPKRKDIQEAYDTLGRWLEIHSEEEAT